METTLTPMQLALSNASEDLDTSPGEAISEVIKNIADFKENAIVWATKVLADDAKREVPILEIKEVKDLTAIVTSVEGTYKQDKPENTTNINILVQQLITRTDDDC